MKPISSEALDVLRDLEIQGNSARIVQQIDRDLYLQVNKALEALGGRWSRAARAHLFDDDPRVAIEDAVLAGGYRPGQTWQQQMGFFETPRSLATRLLDVAWVVPGMRVLEPSAGRGAILRCLPPNSLATAYEVDEAHHEAHLHEASTDCPAAMGIAVVFGDFLSVVPDPVYDACAMNPPFAKGADLAHVTHALSFLRPGGRLAAIMSAGVTFRKGRAYDDFRALLAEHGGEIMDLPADSFRESGTGVNTVMVKMTKCEARP